jgi:MFS family permease
MGLMPLLPVYAKQLGAAPAMVGNYLSFVFAALAVGTFIIGPIASRFQNRRILIGLLSLIAAPATLLMGQVTTLWQLIVLNSVVWFVAGAMVALLGILAGLSAAPHERGKIFGLLAMTTALAGVLGGLTGPIADRWGYPTLFAIVSSVWLVQIMLVPFLYDRKVIPALPTAAGTTRTTGITLPFLLLIGANLLYAVGSFVGTLGRSLAMDSHGFAATAITMTAALGSIAGLVLNPLLGRLSDRINRRLLLAAAYLISGLSLGLLAVAASAIDFSLVALLVAAAGAERAVSSALVTDLLPPEALDRGISLFDAVRWAGGIFGFAGTGYAVQILGLNSAILVGVILPLLAVGLIGAMIMQERKHLQNLTTATPVVIHR